MILTKALSIKQAILDQIGFLQLKKILLFVKLEELIQKSLNDKYEHIIAMLVNMQSNPEKWKIK